MKKAIVTAAGPNMYGVLEYAQPTFKWFADKHGYKLIVDRSAKDGGEHGSNLSKQARWHKLAVIERVLKKHDLIVWLDADIMIRKFDRDIIEDLPADCFQAFVMELFPRRFNPNTGVWVLRNDPESFDFIKRVKELGQQDVYWADQGAVCKALGWELEGYFVTTARPVHYSKYLARTGWLPPEWNPLGMASRWPSRVWHFPSRSNDERVRLMKAAFTKIKPPKVTVPTKKR
jgi:hypothetical protein